MGKFAQWLSEPNTMAFLFVLFCIFMITLLVSCVIWIVIRSFLWDEVYKKTESLADAMSAAVRLNILIAKKPGYLHSFRSLQHAKDQHRLLLEEKIPNFVITAMKEAKDLAALDESDRMSDTLLWFWNAHWGGSSDSPSLILFRKGLLYQLAIFKNSDSYAKAVAEISQGYLADAEPARALWNAYANLGMLISLLDDACPKSLLMLRSVARDVHDLVIVHSYQKQWNETPEARVLDALVEMHAKMIGGELKDKIGKDIISIKTSQLDPAKLQSLPAFIVKKEHVA